MKTPRLCHVCSAITTAPDFCHECGHALCRTCMCAIPAAAPEHHCNALSRSRRAQVSLESNVANASSTEKLATHGAATGRETTSSKRFRYGDRLSTESQAMPPAGIRPLRTGKDRLRDNPFIMADMKQRGHCRFEEAEASQRRRAEEERNSGFNMGRDGAATSKAHDDKAEGDSAVNLRDVRARLAHARPNPPTQRKAPERREWAVLKKTGRGEAPEQVPEKTPERAPEQQLPTQAPEQARPQGLATAAGAQKQAALGTPQAGPAMAGVSRRLSRLSSRKRSVYQGRKLPQLSDNVSVKKTAIIIMIRSIPINSSQQQNSSRTFHHEGAGSHAWQRSEEALGKQAQGHKTTTGKGRAGQGVTPASAGAQTGGDDRAAAAAAAATARGGEAVRSQTVDAASDEHECVWKERYLVLASEVHELRVAMSDLRASELAWHEAHDAALGRGDEDELGLEGLTIVVHMKGKDDLVINTDLREA
ncbi:hypothetical protein RB594_000631 [Gaeumannomyces avenae]